MNECYARYDENTGIFCIGNNRIEKTMRIQGSFLCTLCVKDCQTGTEWTNSTALWQRCPVLGQKEQPSVRMETTEREILGMRPHRKAVLTLEGKEGTVWYEFLIFPDIPFVFSQMFAEKRGSIQVGQKQSETLSCTGIESQYVQTDNGDIFCDTDTLDCIPLGTRHLEVETFTLYDKTDRNDSLLERQTVPVYQNGCLHREGNIFRVSDYPHGDSLMLVKHSPTPSSALHRQNADLLVQGTRYAALLGNGIDFSAMPAGRVPSYASAVGVGKTTDILEEFWRYSTAFSCGDPRKSLFVMSNTWGDRSQDMAICESFILQEIERAHELGVDIVQIDDGWESGITANSRRKSGGVWEGFYADNNDFWKVNPDRFPNGLEPVVAKAKEYGIEIGLWFGPDSSGEFRNVEKDIETLWGLYQRYGIRYFKLDGVKIRSKLCEMRFIHLLEELTRRSGGDIRFNLDVTAEDRFGYLYQTQYGTLFVENRYTDFGNYYPHNTFKNLWSLAAVIPARRLQMELLNNRRNPQKYVGMPFAPAEYRIDYLFASVMPANPLVWMELSHLAEEDAALLAKICALHKQYAAELFESRVIPIGECPNGMHFPGYFCRSRDGKSAHLLLFREQTKEDSYTFALPANYCNPQISVIYQSDPASFHLSEKEIQVDFSKQRSFIWIKIME
ncbi:MAG: alpha-galactosidase [Candidatus Merdivicinus sp.]|jgi:alpha-galactosidase